MQIILKNMQIVDFYCIFDGQFLTIFAKNMHLHKKICICITIRSLMMIQKT